MKYMRFLLIIFVALVIISCTRNNNKYKEVTTTVCFQKGNYQILKDVMLFDTLSKEPKWHLSPIVQLNKEDFFAYIGYEDSMLSIYNLSKKTIVQKNKIDFKEEKNGDIQTVFLQNTDSIFVSQFSRVLLISKNKIIKEWVLNADTNSRNFILDYDENPSFYDAKTKELVLQQSCYVCDNDSTNFLQTAPFVIFNTLDNKIRVPNITYSKKYFDTYYGFMNKVFISNDDENTYLSYMVDPNIYIVNRKTLQVATVGGKCSYQTKDALPLEERYRGNQYSEKKIEHLTLAHSYGNIIVDKYRKLFYRFYYDDIPLKNEHGFFSKYSDKNVTLMVFNKNWCLINEISLGALKNLSSFAFVTKDGLNIKNANSLYTLIKVHE